jgi:hypothetical protein
MPWAGDAADHHGGADMSSARQDDQRHPFDADSFVDGFEEDDRQVPVDPDSRLGEAMAEAHGAEPLDPDFKFEPIPVDD